MHQTFDDGRVLKEEEGHLPFFSMRVRLPKLFDLIAFPIIGGICALFFHSYISGSYGLMAYQVIQIERDVLHGQDSVLDTLISDQKNLNRRLSDNYLDLDLLEERSRVLLGYVHPHDVSAKN